MKKTVIYKLIISVHRGSYSNFFTLLACVLMFNFTEYKCCRHRSDIHVDAALQLSLHG